MPEPVFHSSQQFKQHFIQQLQAMTAQQELGVFILALANAISNAHIYQALAGALAAQFEHIKKQLAQSSSTSMQALPPDDLSVFNALSQLDLSALPLASSKKLQHWQLQFNPLRGFRPARNSQSRVDSIYQPFSHHGFHFNKPFLARETLWQGTLASARVRILYNKFPFADYHGLLLINPELNKPQFLQQQDCVEVQQAMLEMAAVEDIGLAYNSLGAFASVNHQHWQLFVSERDYPVEHIRWSHNNGSQAYPLSVHCFPSLIEAWPVIDHYQQTQQSFNILLRAHKVYLLERKKQGEYPHSDWTSGFAWSEVMGNIMTTRERDFQQLTAQAIEDEFQLLR
ncbi:MAG: hypothetical protein H8E21_06205 [Gammaproteobacteria bacterium]|nr:hypothetical protein [Gammaproteobacteria bacterium]